MHTVNARRKQPAATARTSSARSNATRPTRDIVEVISRHGNYLDDILDWDFYPSDQAVLPRFVIQTARQDRYHRSGENDLRQPQVVYPGWGQPTLIENVAFDMIQNRFIATAFRTGSAMTGCTDEKQIDRKMFSAIFDCTGQYAGRPAVHLGRGTGRMYSTILSPVCAAAKTARVGHATSSAAYCQPKSARKAAKSPGPQKAAAALKQLIQEVRVNKPEINEGKIKVKTVAE